MIPTKGFSRYASSNPIKRGVNEDRREEVTATPDSKIAEKLLMMKYKIYSKAAVNDKKIVYFIYFLSFKTSLICDMLHLLPLNSIIVKVDAISNLRKEET
jgi:hypothetical protein